MHYDIISLRVTCDGQFLTSQDQSEPVGTGHQFRIGQNQEPDCSSVQLGLDWSISSVLQFPVGPVLVLPHKGKKLNLTGLYNTIPGWAHIKWLGMVSLQ